VRNSWRSPSSRCYYGDTEQVLIEFAEAKRNLVFILTSLGLMIGYMVACGIYGNRWLKASLKRKGYVESANA
jgi:hypothetical protein